MKRILFVACVGVMAACTGDTGPIGPAGPSGVNGLDGLNGTNGSNGANGSNGTNGNDIIISDSAKHGLDISPVAIDTTGMNSAQIEAVGQGSYLVNALADCGKCHGEAGTTPGFLAGVATATMSGVNPRNLTPYSANHTTGMQLTRDEFINAMRVGANYTCTGGTCTDNTAHVLSGMPWSDFRWASTYDLEAIYAYLQVIPAVDNTVPTDTAQPGGAEATFPTSYTDGVFPRPLPAELDSNNNPIPDPGFTRRGMAIQFVDEVSSLDAITDARIGRGSYLVNSFGRCRSCHSKTSTSGAQWLTGGKVFTIMATVRSMTADLTGATHGFFGEKTADFTTFEGILQTGTHVDANPATPLAAPMPWQFYRNLTLDDLVAVYTYLQKVQSEVAAGTITTITDDTIAQDASFYCTMDTDCDQAAGETCDLTATDTTYHECIGRTCNVDTDCRVCQVCSGAGGTCGPFVLSTTCKSL